MDYSWKKTFKHLKTGALLAFLTISSVSIANPNPVDPNDALEQLIKQRQKAAQSGNPTAAPSVQQPIINYNFIQPRPATKSESPAAADKPITAAQALSLFQARPAVGNTNMGTSSSIGRGDADNLISSAMGFIGVAYRFGGTTPSGFDCSGFMQYVFRKTFAVNIPRTAAQQANFGSHVSRSNLQPGDMVFFRTAGPRRISHVGMYVGNDRFIHAPRTGKRIEITSLSNKYWSSKYATARRVKRQGADRFISG